MSAERHLSPQYKSLQIYERLRHHFDTSEIERQIAASLTKIGSFTTEFEPDDLQIILRNAAWVLFAQQPLPAHQTMVHTIKSLRAEISGAAMSVAFVAQIFEPIRADIGITYRLTNHPDSGEKNLLLAPRSLHVEQRTRPLDIIAKLALGGMNVERICREVLCDPREAILKTLPDQLQALSFNGTINDVELQITNRNTLRVKLQSSKP